MVVHGTPDFTKIQFCSAIFVHPKKYFRSPVENRKGPIKSGLSVRPASCVTDYRSNRSQDFSETWHEVGGEKCKKRNTAVF